MPKHKITIEFEVNEKQWRLLCMAKAEKPNADRMKYFFIRDAAALVRRVTTDALHDDEQPVRSVRDDWMSDDNVRKLKE